MSGNAREWCLTKWDTGVNDIDDANATRMLRGGTWYYDQDDARCDFRFDYMQVFQGYHFGFRVCVSATI